MTKPTEGDTRAVLSLYQTLIGAWNARDARAFAGCIATDGNVVGFDGSQLDGAKAVEASLSGIFRDHPTASYVTIVRETRELISDVVLLRAVAGMLPPGSATIKKERNAVQSLVAQRTGNEWKVVLFQNTPAAFDGRPEAAEALTRELQAVSDAASRKR